MVELPHTVVGAVIATKIGNPALALPLAFASHFVLDLLPHWNPHLNKEKKEFGKISKKTTIIVAIDTALSLAVGTGIAALSLPDIKKFIVVMAGAFLAVLPDVIEGPYFFLGWDNIPAVKKLIKLQSSIQFNIPKVPGIITQIILLAAVLGWLVR